MATNNELFMKDLLYEPLKKRFTDLTDVLRTAMDFYSWPFELTMPLPNDDARKSFLFRGYPLSNLTLVGEQPQRIVCARLNSMQQYGVSFQFTGCAMARFLDYNHNPYICHIYICGNNDCKPLWKNFIKQCGRDLSSLTIFKPYTPTMEKFLCLFTFELKVSVTVAGIISPKGECYSALMRTSDLWIIYCEKVKPLAQFDFISPYYQMQNALNAVDVKLTV